MSRARGAESRSFEEWYAVAAAELTRTICASVGDPVLGREVAAEAFARAFERWGRVGRMDSPEGWVHRTAVNLVRRSWRRRQIERRALAKLGTREDAIVVLDADDVVVAGHRPEAVAALVDGLPNRMQDAVRLRYWDELSEAEVAERMVVAPGTASALLSQARRHLARSLEREPATEKEDLR